MLILPTMVLATPEYDACYNKAQDDDQVALCMKAETLRLMKTIQEIYINVSKNEQTASWNKGNGLISGNLKDMYESWLNYRNKYCSLFTVASEHMFGSESFDHERCLLNMTNDHLELMKTIIVNANSGGDEHMLENGEAE
jgi:uncharacterized protein YecT (DUF1311 family)